MMFESRKFAGTFFPGNMSLAVFGMLNYTENCRQRRDVGENNLAEAKRIIKLRKLCQYQNAGKSFHYSLNLWGGWDISRLAGNVVSPIGPTAGDLSCRTHMPSSWKTLRYLNRSLHKWTCFYHSSRKRTKFFFPRRFVYRLNPQRNFPRRKW